MTTPTDPDRVPEFWFHDLTLEQLEGCVRGDLQALLPSGKPVALRLRGDELGEYEDAKSRGWVVWRSEEWKAAVALHFAWGAFCRIAHRPKATLEHGWGGKTAHLRINLYGDVGGLPEAAACRIHAIVRAFANKGQSLSVSTSGVEAQLPGTGEASAVMQQLLDMILESVVPDPGGHVRIDAAGRVMRFRA